MGTGFNSRLILIAGRKSTPAGAAPLKTAKDVVANSFEELYSRVMDALKTANKMDAQTAKRTKSLEAEAAAMMAKMGLYSDSGLEGPYRPGADACFTLDTVVPDSMDTEIHEALARLRHEIAMPIEDYVQNRLGYRSMLEMCRALSAEQVDAVALAIYNIEYRGQGMVIGDQTGIGKGRVAASMIRYGVNRGLKPIFLTEKANLFSDLYRDLLAIGSDDLVPYIVNARDAKTAIKSPDGEIIHKPPLASIQDTVIRRQAIPDKYDFVMATYSQFNQPKKKYEKADFLYEIARGNIMVLDESHNASGGSNTGQYMQSVVRDTLGVTFLSATFAKRPDNMPIYALKTSMSDATMSTTSLTEVIEKGGVALQEILASQLVSEGQMIRRERSYEGIEVNYITLDKTAESFGLYDKKEEHQAIFDNITDIIQDIIDFQQTGVKPYVDEMDEALAPEGAEANARGGTEKAGVDNSPYFSKVFHIVNQMLFAIKAESVAELAIKRLKEGKKPVIAFSSTMGSFLNDLATPGGSTAENGDVVRADFASTLQRGLESVLKITITEEDGEKTFEKIQVSSLSPSAQAQYRRISQRIKTISSGITISPIDQIKQLISDAGYRVGEVTGRQQAIELDLETMNPREVINSKGQMVTEGMIIGTLKRRKKPNTADLFRRFNDNEIDVLMINQSGSTGASAHAIPTPKVSKAMVKQRVMIVLQPELDISTEIQKRGRINRTGQIFKPIYDYVISAIPAEQRLMMMLQKKLKSLDANTSSNQKQSEAMLSTDDFLNKYGDKVIVEYLKENPGLDAALGKPLEGNASSSNSGAIAQKVSGRVAILSTAEQEKYYREVIGRYHDYVDILKSEGRYDLEVEVLDLQAKTLESNLKIVGKGRDSVFGDDTMLELIEARNLRKPFTKAELMTVLESSLAGKTPGQYRRDLVEGFATHQKNALAIDLEQEEIRINKKIKAIESGPKFLAIDSTDEKMDFYEARRAEFLDEHEKRTEEIKAKYLGLDGYIGGMFRFFEVGKGVKVPMDSDEIGGLGEDGVFLGFVIDTGRPNPYAPSAIRLRFAVASSRKSVNIPASGEGKKLAMAIKGASSDLTTSQKENTLLDWEELTSRMRRDWNTRYVLTGNILQGLGRFRTGKLVSYTTREGGTKKGILLNEDYAPDTVERGEVTVPLARAKTIVQSIPIRHLFHTTDGVTFARKSTDEFQILVPGSKSKGGKYFLNEEVRDLVVGRNFNRVSGQMVGTFGFDDLEVMLNLLQDTFGETCVISREQYERIKATIPRRKPKSPLPKIEVRTRKDDDLKLLELEAEALLLTLKLFGDAA
jgi:hypothetical protein